MEVSAQPAAKRKDKKINFVWNDRKMNNTNIKIIITFIGINVLPYFYFYNENINFRPHKPKCIYNSMEMKSGKRYVILFHAYII